MINDLNPLFTKIIILFEWLVLLFHKHYGGIIYVTLCDEFDMSTSTAFTIFASTMVRNRRIPFAIEAPAREEAVNKGKTAFDKVRDMAMRGELLDLTVEEINDEI